MKKIYFTVGPSQIYPTIPKHLNEALNQDIPSMSHRGPEFKKLYSDLDSNLKKLLGIPQNYQIFFVSSALEAMERTILGTVERNSYHIITGSFGKAWAKYAGELGKKVVKRDLTDVILNNPPSHPERSSEGSNLYSSLAHQNDIKEAEIICITQNDTSTGIQIPMEEIYSLKKKYPEKLIAIDVVSSIPYVDIDYTKIDITFFSVQKAFGLPAGLGVMIVSDAAIKRCSNIAKKGVIIGSYHSLQNLSEKYLNFQTPETPNVLNIFLLNKICLALIRKGIRKIRVETEQKANLIYDFFDNHSIYHPIVQLTEFRSKTTPVIETRGETEKIRCKLSKRDFEVSSGYGENKHTQLRIANFPAHTIKDIQNLLSNFKL